MRVYLDVNVLIDLSIGRAPYGLEAAEAITVAQMNDMQIVTSPNSFVIAFFYARKQGLSPQFAKHSLALTRRMVDCVTVDAQVVDTALSRPIPKDLEDGVQIEAAIAAGADIFLSNDKKFLKLKGESIRMLSTAQFVKAFTPT